ncbi:ABC transporter ATP-binding protein [Paenibacillus koleovorans]|uniref:ABC transporter ATP-binding protein n=1 Tax=Paenibacillus koleovorans TaxID=121608 RepID=UPI000FDB698D|nr:ABC transporter ATP-binding protein [Paenibacillus koleovorans]
MKAVELKGFTKDRGDFRISDLNVHVEQGFITGLIGPNGAGKTTLIRAMLGLVRPDTGEVRVFGNTYREREQEIKSRIGFVFSEDTYYNHLTVREMKKIVASFYPTTWKEELFRQYLEEFRLPERRKIGELSQGMKTKFALAATLAHEPELLIMDEPTAGLDPVFRREVLALLGRYIQEGNRTVLFSTHISTDLERIADYMIYLRDGRVRFCGSKEELLDTYVLLKGSNEWLKPETRRQLAGLQQSPLGFEGLLPREKLNLDAMDSRIRIERPTIDDILVYTQQHEQHRQQLQQHDKEAGVR